MRRILVAAIAVVVAVGAVVVLVERQRGRDVRGSTSVEFSPADAPHARVRGRGVRAVDWPTYGFGARRVRVAPQTRLRPPFRRLWTFHGRALLEFPPAVAGGRVYVPTFDGRLVALDARSGRALWRYASGRCSWASPAVAGGLVYETFLSAGDCRTQKLRSGGTLTAFAARTGRVRWSRPLAPTESSPLVVAGRVVIGDWSGVVTAFDRRTGRTGWSRRLGGQVKGSAAAAHGAVYIGAYDGHVYALDARTGELRWRASAQPRLRGLGSFYATPAVAYGRVYIGATDRKVYSFGERSGKLRWSRTTGGYVYASAAVWSRLVLVGSYDGVFYALDAATGEIRWRFRSNGPISGAATVLDGLVYFSTLHGRTYALEARSGRLVWSWPDGKYSPVVSDGLRVYLVGLGRLYAMVRAG